MDGWVPLQDGMKDSTKMEQNTNLLSNLSNL